MDLGPHGAFIVAAYAAAAIIVLLLLLWVIADHRAQRRLLARLEQRGRTRATARRSEPA
ncbi:MAG TPA: heme exporter protein CcmD [Xanthobacteraceae bacterium]|nr:heme exporter protein CcmD [Xanthobacteraceae bacterium]